jgi:hypothetical protein
MSGQSDTHPTLEPFIMVIFARNVASIAHGIQSGIFIDAVNVIIRPQ